MKSHVFMANKLAEILSPLFSGGLAKYHILHHDVTSALIYLLDMETSFPMKLSTFSFKDHLNIRRNCLLQNSMMFLSYLPCCLYKLQGLFAWRKGCLTLYIHTIIALYYMPDLSLLVPNQI